MAFQCNMRLLHKMKRKRIMVAVIILVGAISLFTIVTLINAPINDIDRNFRLSIINNVIKTQTSVLACKQPKLPVFAPEMMKFIHEEPQIDCSSVERDWVKCEGSLCKIQEGIREQYGNVNCIFTDVIRVDDFQSRDGKITQSNTFYKLEASDVVRVNCNTSNRRWSATLTGIRHDPNLQESHFSSDSSKFNVLMFGFDSLSRNSFIRKLPNSYQYLVEVLQGDVLEGYNIVGDGTPQALIPLLTGKTELELPDTRKRLADTNSVNVYPFIWNEYKNAGYVTSFFEDVPELGTFTYRLNGFNEPPTDHYMRLYYLESYKERRKYPKLCTGDVPRHQIMLNEIKNFFMVYPEAPKFLFGFHGELSHDNYNLVGVADKDLREFLRWLKESGYLDDTILILMADHGHRFAEIRNTLQGKQEERLPFFSFTFPRRFKEEFPQAYVNFKNNLNKLTTPFDIHETLRSILDLNDFSMADISNRAVSLFRKIPSERSCAHAYIEPHWCACLEWNNISLPSTLADRLANALVKTINDYTKPQRYLCEFLKVKNIEWAMIVKPNEMLMKYNKNADLDGFVADLSARMTLNTELYQVKVVLTPGDSIFEASITHFVEQDELLVKMSDISRVNLYGTQARCVENHLPHLRKYCFCKN